ncbi:hypothetical protein EIK77_006711 [Talaromyces pinophilus]|nr:hypothetical protein EIK77_006711 [Talaromyces pinophilus]
MWAELVLPTIKLRQQVLFSKPETLALESAHATAFHRGLGETSFAAASAPFESYFTEDGLAEFAQSAYAKPNISLVSVGPNSSEVSKWVSQFFAGHSAAPAAGQFKVKDAVPSKFYGGEQRTASKAGNAVVISFPGSAQYGASGYKAEADVLAALLGGESTIKWSPGFSLLAKAVEGETGVSVSTKNYAYSDAGLFTITISGKAAGVATVAKRAADAVKQIAAGEVPAEVVKKAIALAKFRALEASQVAETGVELTGSALINGGKPYQISELVSSFEKVSPQQVQDVCPPVSVLIICTNVYQPVGQILRLRKSLHRRRWRLAQTSFRRRPWSHRLSGTRYDIKEEIRHRRKKNNQKCIRFRILLSLLCPLPFF